MIKGFNITRFKPGTIVMRLRRAQTTDCSWIGCPAELVSIEKNILRIKFLNLVTLKMGERVAELEMSNFKHGWIRLEDYMIPGFGLPTEAITGVEEKNFYKVCNAFRKENCRLDFENDCRRRKKNLLLQKGYSRGGGEGVQNPHHY